MWSKSSITALLHIDIQQQATENATPAKKQKLHRVTTMHL
jgi:hypothetical protein